MPTQLINNSVLYQVPTGPHLKEKPSQVHSALGGQGGRLYPNSSSKDIKIYSH